MAQFENATIQSACFDSVVGYDEQTGLPTYDRALTGADVREVFNMIIFDGVFDDGSFLVTDAGGGNVTVAPGHGFVHGAPVWDNSSETVTLEAPDPTQPRVDSIVLQFNNTLPVRRVIKVVKVGTPGSSEPPTLQRDADIWELQLCTIARAAGTAAPTSITDTRDNASVCGFVTSVPAMLKDYLPLMAGQDNALKGTLYGTSAQMSGDVTIEGDLDVGGGMSFSGPVGTGPLTVEGGANVSGNVLAGPTLTLRNSSTQAAQAEMRSTGTTFFIGNENGGDIALRPNGSADSNGQMVINTAGWVSISGGMNANGSVRALQYLYLRDSSRTIQAVLRSTDSGFYVSNENPGSIVLRPNGTTSATGQAVLSTAGDLSTAGALKPTGSIVGNQTAAMPLIISRANAGTIALRPNGVSSESGQVYVDTSGNILGEKYDGVSLRTGVTLYRVGKMRFLRVEHTASTLSAGNNTILNGIIPTNDRPTGRINFPATIRTGTSSVVGYGNAGIDGNGNLYYIATAARTTAATIDCLMVWLTA